MIALFLLSLVTIVPVGLVVINVFRVFVLKR
jgi:hypothetical protein